MLICQGCGARLETWTGECPSCGSKEHIEVGKRSDSNLGRVIANRYKIVRKLGQGGMGSVYQAEHTGVGQKVAIKFLNPSFSDDPDIVRRFLNEARSYAQLSHPHAVQLHDFGQDELGQLYISMEFVEGEDLKRTLERLGGRLPLKDALDVVLQVCDVLSYAHSKGIVHRDLKPENVMLVRGLTGYYAKVLDFGVARLMTEGEGRVTVAGSICGTPRYMSPEQAEGRDVDHRTDVYALGLVLFESVTGTHPFGSASVAETLRMQVQEPVPALSEAAPTLEFPDALNRAVQKAVVKDREQRFASMADMAQALVPLLPSAMAESKALEPTSAETMVRRPLEKTAYPAAPQRPPSRVLPRWLLPVAGGAGVAVGLGLFLAFGPRGLSGPVVPPAIPPPKVEPTNPEPAKPDPAKPDPTKPDPAKSEVEATQPEPAKPEPRGQPSDSAAAATVRLAADTGMYGQAYNEFLAGRLDTSGNMLKSILPDSPIADRVGELRGKIAELRSLLKRADAEYRKGKCREATALYQQALGKNPGLASAQQGVARCRREMPAATLD